MWNPSLYLRFGDERTRPCLDLIQRIGLAEPRRIVDLGCGPGNSTATLRARWPVAQITGVDNSAEMLSQARQSGVDAQWSEADVAQWQPAEPADLIFSNAAFQWIPNQRVILPRLLGHLRPAGVLAIQVPYHLQSPAHVAIEELCAEPPWRAWLDPRPEPFEILEPDGYYRLLAPLTAKLEIWQTTYWHILERPTSIVEWMRGTGLRPYLERLPAEEQETFLAAYQAKVEKAFPAQPDGGALFPFPRLFLVAQR